MGDISHGPLRPEQELPNMPEHVLFHLARNESADRAWRKAAVAIMLEKGYRSAHNPELYGLLEDILKEREARQEVTAAVEAAVETPEEDWPIPLDGLKVVAVPANLDSPALKASVTTQTLYEDPAKGE